MTATVEHQRRVMPHPKIRERRIKVRRDEGRRRLRRLLTLSAVVVTALAGLAATRSPVLDVDRVTVRGEGHTEVDDILRASGLRKRQPMVEVDAGAAARRVEALPWVADARVERRWPAEVRIEVEERTAVAQVLTTAGTWALLDVDGRLLELLPAPAARLVRFTSPVKGRPGDELGRRLSASRSVAGAIDTPLDQRISEIRERDGSVELRLAEGGQVIFGPPENVPEKLRALDQLLATGPRLCPIWDVRVPSAPVLTPGNGCV